jgi:hypothetical protein
VRFAPESLHPFLFGQAITFLQEKELTPQWSALVTAEPTIAAFCPAKL